MDNHTHAVKVRPATIRDYNDVVGIIPDLYDGLDYLPAHFCKYIRDPHYRLVVAELHGKVVGLRGAVVVDEGQTVIFITGRIAPEYQKSGVYEQIKGDEYLVRELGCKVKTVLINSARWDIYRRFIKRGMPYKLIMVRNIVKVKVLPNALVSDMDFGSPSAHLTCYIDSLQAKAALQNPDNQWRIFPLKRIMHAGKVYSLGDSNFDAILKESCSFVATMVTGESDQSRCLSLSAGSTHFTNKGTRYNMDYYGNDFDDLVCHLAMHCRNTHKYFLHDGVYMYLYLPPTLPMDSVVNMIGNISWLSLYIKPFPTYVAELLWSKM